jgi:DNA-directed RNA polymerase I subunit RPA49
VLVNGLLTCFRIKQYFAELGCRLNLPTEADRTKLKITKAESSSHTIAKLKLPLKFPQLGRGPPKKR